MSKIIKITENYIGELCEEFEKTLRNTKLTDGKITYTKTFNSNTRKAELYFSEIAWMKMQTLVREFDKEVAWHGIARRGLDPSKDEYLISDILVYPQEVTGATVNTDQVKYQTWLMSHDDEVFSNIRMQGHSHVNMGTSPSTVDIAHQEKILEQLEDDMFYIFVIWNKKNEKTIKIYDLEKNILFENSDITVGVLEDDTGVESFLKNAKEMVSEKTYVYNYSSGLGTQISSPSGAQPSHTANINVVTPPSKNSSQNLSQNITGVTPSTNSSKKKKGKRKKDKSKNKKENANYQVGFSDFWWQQGG